MCCPTLQALLSLVGCTLRQAASWRQHSGPGSPSAPAATIAPLLSNALRLAVANTACNCRDVSQRAVAVLSSLAVLALEWGSPLGAETRAFLRVHGSGVVQGMLLALMSLNSASHLPKVTKLLAAWPAWPAGAYDSSRTMDAVLFVTKSGKQFVWIPRASNCLDGSACSAAAPSIHPSIPGASLPSSVLGMLCR